MSNSNYGTILLKGIVAVGEIISTGLPELIAGKAETTNHSGGGWRSFIPTGLKELGEFELTILATAVGTEEIYDDMIAEAIDTYTVQYADLTLDSWTFDAFPTSLKVTDAKADSPEAMQIVVKFQPTGALTVEDDAEDEWYTYVTGLSILGGDIEMLVGGADVTLSVVDNFGNIAPIADLTFESSDEGIATVSAAGVVAAIGDGTAYIKATITAKTSIDAVVEVTVTGGGA